ncbi:MAG: hypothetical protein U0903_12750 [Planctomycetales bacterium]
MQSSSPDEPAIQWAAKHNFEEFARAEVEHRREGESPPFSHLARVILRAGGSNRGGSRATDGDAPQESITGEGVAGADPGAGGRPRCPKSRGDYRYHLQMSSVDVKTIHDLWEASLGEISLPTDVDYVVDVDPMNMR